MLETRFEVAGEMFAKYRKKIAEKRVRGATGQQNRVGTGKIGVDLATEGLGLDEILAEPGQEWGVA